MTANEIINLIISIVSIIPTLISVGVLIYNIIKNKNWTLMTKIIDTAMCQVEEYAREHPTMTSDEKLDMAIQAAKEGLKVAGIELNDAALKRLIEYVKESIGWHNDMNGRGTK